MGAEQSSARGTAASDSLPKKTDYYELLQVERTATDEELVPTPIPVFKFLPTLGYCGLASPFSLFP